MLYLISLPNRGQSRRISKRTIQLAFIWIRTEYHIVGLFVDEHRRVGTLERTIRLLYCTLIRLCIFEVFAQGKYRSHKILKLLITTFTNFYQCCNGINFSCQLIGWTLKAALFKSSINKLWVLPTFRLSNFSVTLFLIAQLLCSAWKIIRTHSLFIELLKSAAFR